jgi:membrane protease YdiL (CAAX protease family)
MAGTLCCAVVEVEAAQSRPRPSHFRLAFWALFVAVIAAANYYGRFSGGNSSVGRGSSKQEIYSYATFAGGTILYAVWLGIILLIVVDRFDLLALRPPRGWGRALGLGAGVIGAILVWEYVTAFLPLPQSPGKEQGITNVKWEPAHAGAFAANFVLFAVIAPFVEELTFRGSGQSLLRFLGRAPSILLVGVAFGVAHGLVEALLVLVPFGIALAWLRDRTGSVFPGMLVHALFNGTALALIVVR